MPDIAMHHSFGQEVRASLPQEIQEFLAEVPFTFALYGPDIWFMHRPWQRRQGRGRRMHTTRTGAFLMSLALRTRNGFSPRETFAYLAGFLCHYALDSVTHPYIIWQTTHTWPSVRAHRDFEHALDVLLVKREGYWGEKHPLTDHHYPELTLPACLAEDLNAIYAEIYGWPEVFSSLNRCYAGYRLFFRALEKPKSFLIYLAHLFPTARLRSLPHAASAFLDRDVMNLSHRSWHEAYDPRESFTESFPELYEKAKSEAVRMISDCFTFARNSDVTEEYLRQSLGSRSYLSGLPVDDPRNYTVPSLRPSEDLPLSAESRSSQETAPRGEQKNR